MDDSLSWPVEHRIRRGKNLPYVFRPVDASGEMNHAALERDGDRRGAVISAELVEDMQDVDLIVVGHSYGRAVITGAAAANRNVKALVYIAAFAPGANEPIGAFGEKFPSSLRPALRPDAASFPYIDTAAYHSVFADDLPIHDTRVMAVAQKPVFGGVFGESVPTPAWRSIPSWYVVAQQDRAINPELEHFYAKRRGATIRELRSSHVSFTSRAEDVAKVIGEAAGSR